MLIDWPVECLVLIDACLVIICCLANKGTIALCTFELCTFAPALFQSTGVLLEATKSTLGESIYKMVQCQQTDIPKDVQYVLDGGDLLHKIPWV